jgi:hypothetical protein
MSPLQSIYLLAVQQAKTELLQYAGVAKTGIGWNIEGPMVELKHFHATIYI